LAEETTERRPGISVIIATAFREATLLRTLEALARQTRRPDEVVVVDGATAPGVGSAVTGKASALGLKIIYKRAGQPSAAAQRNLGVELASGSILLFLDDDAYPEPDCVEKILAVFATDSPGAIGGVGTLLSNQHSHPPSPRARRWFEFLAGEKRESYSGTVIGPAVNILPQATEDGRIVPVEWLNSTCTAYRRKAFLAERFGERFVGYSFMEDVDLSVRIARHWKLVVHTGAQAYHDSQPSRFKRPYARARMMLENRYYVMTTTLRRTTLKDHLKFLVAVAMGKLFGMRGIRRPRDLADWLLALCGTIRGLGGVACTLPTRLWFRRK
jgi:GT2 family glycosyltransferase